MHRVDEEEKGEGRLPADGDWGDRPKLIRWEIEFRGLLTPPSIGQRMLSGRTLRPLRRLFSTTPCRRADPWPLPHTKQHMEATTIPPDIPKPIPIPRHNESLETLRARLTYQTRKRGTLESDLIMSTFAKEHLHSLTRAELLELDQVTEHVLSSISKTD